MNLKQLDDIKAKAFHSVEFHIIFKFDKIFWISISYAHKLQTLYTGRKNSGLSVVNRPWTTYKPSVEF